MRNVWVRASDTERCAGVPVLVQMRIFTLIDISGYSPAARPLMSLVGLSG